MGKRERNELLAYKQAMLGLIEMMNRHGEVRLARDGGQIYAAILTWGEESLDHEHVGERGGDAHRLVLDLNNFFGRGR